MTQADAMLTPSLANPVASETIAVNPADAVGLHEASKFGGDVIRAERRPDLSHGIDEDVVAFLVRDRHRVAVRARTGGNVHEGVVGVPRLERALLHVNLNTVANHVERDEALDIVAPLGAVFAAGP